MQTMPWLCNLFCNTLDAATYPRSVARTGVLQGDAANANVRPAKYACTPESKFFQEKL